MKNLVEHIAQALVDEPEAVSVTEIRGEQVTVLELRAEKYDLGKLIGKEGRNALAIRTILYAVAAKEKRRCILEIVD